jgi:hypothetical protein
VKTPWFAIYWVPFWDVDFHVYDAPLQVIVHTPRWVLQVRPFSNYAQGGDLRGRTDLHGYESVKRWLLDDNTPEDFARLGGPVTWDRRTCVTCLHDAETCNMIGCKRPRHVRRLAWLRHVSRRPHWRHRFEFEEETRDEANG